MVRDRANLDVPDMQASTMVDCVDRYEDWDCNGMSSDDSARFQFCTGCVQRS